MAIGTISALCVLGNALAGTCSSKGTGTLATPLAWNTGGNWTGTCAGPGGRPAAGDIVTVVANDVVVIDANANAGTLRVNGRLRFGANAATNVRSLTLNGTGTALTISNTGNFDVNQTSAVTTVTHTLTLSGGDISNAGTFNMAIQSPNLQRATVAFTRVGNQNITGAGATYKFYRITQNVTNGNTLEVTSTATGFSIDSGNAGALTLTTGTFKLSAALTAALNPFDGLALAQNIPNGAGIWIAGNSTVNIATTFAGNFTMSGVFQIDAGTVTVGNAIGEKFVLGSFATAEVKITGGTLNVGGMFGSATLASDSGKFTMSGGAMNYATAGQPAQTAFGLGASTTLSLTGGTITQQRDTSANPDVDIRSSTATVDSTNGGNLWVFGNASTTGTTTFSINAAGQAKLWNMEVNTTASPSLTLASNLTVSHNVTIDTGATLILSTFTLTMGGDFSNSGTLTPNTGTVTFTNNGDNAASIILGSTLTTFYNLTVSKAAGIDITTIPTINNILTFTATGGHIRATSPKLVTLGTAATVSGAGTANGWVEGSVQKNYTVAACTPLTATFPVGDATTYAGVVITGGTATGTGTPSLTVSVSTPDLAQVTTPITTTLIDKTKSVNRYWTFVNVTLDNASCASVSATFNYAAADNDNVANAANYVVQRYDRTVTSFFPATVTPTPTSTQLLATNVILPSGVTTDVAIGAVLTGVVTNLGSFNAFDTGTTTGAITGLIQTKVSGTAFNLTIAALNATRSASALFVGGSQYTVQLLDATTAGTPDANGCDTVNWPVIQSNTNLVPGAVARFNTAFTVANAYKKVRVRIFLQTTPTTNGCSSDQFAIRPSTLAVAAYDSTYQAAATAGTARALANSAATGGNVHSAAIAGVTALPFTLRATAKNSSGTTISTYQSQGGVPTQVVGSGACVDYGNGCTNGTLVVAVGSWAAAASSGSVTGERETTANYDEAGAFTLQIEDMTFADADIPDGSSTAQRYVPAAAAATIGRFVPSQFVVTTTNTPQLKAYCGVGAAAFTYIGQKFAYRSTLEPQARITAQNSGGNITTNYRGSTATTFHLTKAMVSQTYANLGSGSLDDALAKLADGAMTLTVNSGAGASGNGTAALTLSSNDRLLFTRNTAAPSNAFNAAIRLTVAAGDTSETGVTGNPASITTTTSGVFDNGGTGIQFVDTGNTLVTTTNNLGPFRYGRLRLSNAVGSERLSLNMPIQAEYWVNNGFTKNTDDTCTVLNPAKTTLSMANYKGTGTGTALASGNMSVASNLTLTGANVNVSGYLKLSKPSPIATGSVDLTVDLSVAGEDKSYLQGAWNGTTTYTANPKARASFGMYGAQSREFIYFRENY